MKKELKGNKLKNSNNNIKEKKKKKKKKKFVNFNSIEDKGYEENKNKLNYIHPKLNTNELELLRKKQDVLEYDKKTVKHNFDKMNNFQNNSYISTEKNKNKNYYISDIEGSKNIYETKNKKINKNNKKAYLPNFNSNLKNVNKDKISNENVTSFKQSNYSLLKDNYDKNENLVLKKKNFKNKNNFSKRNCKNTSYFLNSSNKLNLAYTHKIYKNKYNTYCNNYGKNNKNLKNENTNIYNKLSNNYLGDIKKYKNNNNIAYSGNNLVINNENCISSFDNKYIDSENKKFDIDNKFYIGRNYNSVTYNNSDYNENIYNVNNHNCSMNNFNNKDMKNTLNYSKNILNNEKNLNELKNENINKEILNNLKIKKKLNKIKNNDHNSFLKYMESKLNILCNILKYIFSVNENNCIHLIKYVIHILKYIKKNIDSLEDSNINFNIFVITLNLYSCLCVKIFTQNNKLKIITIKCLVLIFEILIKLKKNSFNLSYVLFLYINYLKNNKNGIDIIKKRKNMKNKVVNNDEKTYVKLLNSFLNIFSYCSESQSNLVRMESLKSFCYILNMLYEHKTKGRREIENSDKYFMFSKNLIIDCLLAKKGNFLKAFTSSKMIFLQKYNLNFFDNSHISSCYRESNERVEKEISVLSDYSNIFYSNMSKNYIKKKENINSCKSKITVSEQAYKNKNVCINLTNSKKIDEGYSNENIKEEDIISNEEINKMVDKHLEKNNKTRSLILLTNFEIVFNSEPNSGWLTNKIDDEDENILLFVFKIFDLFIDIYNDKEIYEIILKSIVFFLNHVNIDIFSYVTYLIIKISNIIPINKSFFNKYISVLLKNLNKDRRKHIFIMLSHCKYEKNGILVLLNILSNLCLYNFNFKTNTHLINYEHIENNVLTNNTDNEYIYTFLNTKNKNFINESQVNNDTDMNEAYIMENIIYNNEEWYYIHSILIMLSFNYSNLIYNFFFNKLRKNFIQNCNQFSPYFNLFEWTYKFCYFISKNSFDTSFKKKIITNQKNFNILDDFNNSTTNYISNNNSNYNNNSNDNVNSNYNNDNENNNNNNDNDNVNNNNDNDNENNNNNHDNENSNYNIDNDNNNENYNNSSNDNNNDSTTITITNNTRNENNSNNNNTTTITTTNNNNNSNDNNNNDNNNNDNKNENNKSLYKEEISLELLSYQSYAFLEYPHCIKLNLTYKESSFCFLYIIFLLNFFFNKKISFFGDNCFFFKRDIWQLFHEHANIKTSNFLDYLALLKNLNFYYVNNNKDLAVLLDHMNNMFICNFKNKKEHTYYSNEISEDKMKIITEENFKNIKNKEEEVYAEKNKLKLVENNRLYQHIDSYILNDHLNSNEKIRNSSFNHNYKSTCNNNNFHNSLPFSENNLHLINIKKNKGEEEKKKLETEIIKKRKLKEKKKEDETNKEKETKSNEKEKETKSNEKEKKNLYFRQSYMKYSENLVDIINENIVSKVLFLTYLRDNIRTRHSLCYESFLRKLIIDLISVQLIHKHNFFNTFYKHLKNNVLPENFLINNFKRKEDCIIDLNSYKFESICMNNKDKSFCDMVDLSDISYFSKSNDIKTLKNTNENLELNKINKRNKTKRENYINSNGICNLNNETKYFIFEGNKRKINRKNTNNELIDEDKNNVRFMQSVNRKSKDEYLLNKNVNFKFLKSKIKIMNNEEKIRNREKIDLKNKFQEYFYHKKLINLNHKINKNLIKIFYLFNMNYFYSVDISYIFNYIINRIYDENNFLYNVLINHLDFFSNYESELYNLKNEEINLFNDLLNNRKKINHFEILKERGNLKHLLIGLDCIFKETNLNNDLYSLNVVINNILKRIINHIKNEDYINYNNCIKFPFLLLSFFDVKIKLFFEIESYQSYEYEKDFKKILQFFPYHINDFFSNLYLCIEYEEVFIINNIERKKRNLIQPYNNEVNIKKKLHSYNNNLLTYNFMVENILSEDYSLKHLKSLNKNNKKDIKNSLFAKRKKLKVINQSMNNDSDFNLDEKYLKINCIEKKKEETNIYKKINKSNFHKIDIKEWNIKNCTLNNVTSKFSDNYRNILYLEFKKNIEVNFDYYSTLPIKCKINFCYYNFKNKLYYPIPLARAKNIYIHPLPTIIRE
ncbi:conserved Plasmodium protein, unknown function [Plasmodium gallinaceum]|uniref:Development protein n=1 Tax=Plasmodium gallinaceum TaxID=5849 RepID=A0A1J1GNL5_PLAGA|nr:conserved Plasmodium protein, unknown function [Plasmodium gallinaceum]CRG94050.1 conserved Plasmodium protein, unknown function [Plasmodium gallinaceum]